jgi:hypothetical protein
VSSWSRSLHWLKARKNVLRSCSRISGFPPSFPRPIFHHNRLPTLDAEQRGVTGSLMSRDSVQPWPSNPKSRCFDRRESCLVNCVLLPPHSRSFPPPPPPSAFPLSTSRASFEIRPPSVAYRAVSGITPTGVRELGSSWDLGENDDGVLLEVELVLSHI